MNMARRLTSRYRTIKWLLKLTYLQHQKREVVEVSVPQVELDAKFIERGNDIEKSYDEITGQIRQGEGGSSK
jgi:hypothetical protein